MVTTTRTARTPPWRSTSPIPLRPAEDVQPDRGTATPRIPLALSSPSVPDGQFRPSAFAGEVVPFRTTAFREGHDRIGVHVRLFSPSGDESLHLLRPLNDGFDRWETAITPLEEGVWGFRFEAFGDDFATWEHAADLKIAAGVDTAVMRELGAQLFDRAVAEKSRPITERRRLESAAAALRDHATTHESTLELVRDPSIAAFFRARPLTSLMTIGRDHELLVERERAGVGAWYEFFPRSEGARLLKDGTVKSGTFRTAMRRIPAVAAMGFDVLYLPPIHPIGRINRKGRNNTLDPQPGDPGSPWAIGSDEGGHDAVHPDLGSLADFRAFVRAARAEGIEVALDFALQAAPDHPWVKAHPEWFTTLPDGSIAYAENPPKKYQDIYPINFDNDPDGIRAEALRVVRHWIAQGVKIFRVDNPHTKPLQFWEWLIATVSPKTSRRRVPRRGVHPSGAAAGTRAGRFPAELHVLHVAQHQARTRAVPDRPRPRHGPLPATEPLREHPRHPHRVPAVRRAPRVQDPGGDRRDRRTDIRRLRGLRAVRERRAAGFRGEHRQREVRVQDPRLGGRRSARRTRWRPYLTRLNEIRRAHPALRQLRNLTVHWSDDDAILVFSKRIAAELSPTGHSDTILVVANVDPHSVRQTMVHLDTTVWGVAPGDPFDVEDLITGERWTWSDHNFVKLDAFTEPVHILHVKESR